MYILFRYELLTTFSFHSLSNFTVFKKIITVMTYILKIRLLNYNQFIVIKLQRYKYTYGKNIIFNFYGNLIF